MDGDFLPSSFTPPDIAGALAVAPPLIREELERYSRRPIHPLENGHVQWLVEQAREHQHAIAMLGETPEYDRLYLFTRSASGALRFREIFSDEAALLTLTHTLEGASDVSIPD